MLIHPIPSNQDDVIYFATGQEQSARIGSRALSFFQPGEEKRTCSHVELSINIATFTHKGRRAVVEIEWKGGARPTAQCDLAERISDLIASLFPE